MKKIVGHIMAGKYMSEHALFSRSRRDYWDIFACMELANDVKNILGLHLPTDPRWVDLASISLEDILTDHAYCEQKAATSCITLIQRYSDKEKLVTELAPIVTEEWGHFRLVLNELKKRKLTLGKQRKDA